MPVYLDDDDQPVEPYLLETIESRPVVVQADGSSTGTLVGKVVGTEDADEAYDLAVQGLPDAWPGTQMDGALHDIAIEPIPNSSDCWLVRATYIGRGPYFTFDTTGGTKHITQSKDTINAFAPEGQTPPDFGGAIGVTDESVEGVDIVIPVYKFAETHRLKVEDVTPDYLRTLFESTSCTNESPFRWFDTDEVLFLGARGAQRGNDLVEVTFEFQASPNITEDNPLQIGDIEVTEKRGWDVLWVRYVDKVDPDAVPKARVKKPASVHIERVYDSADFALLFPDGREPQFPADPDAPGEPAAEDDFGEGVGADEPPGGAGG